MTLKTGVMMLKISFDHSNQLYFIIYSQKTAILNCNIIYFTILFTVFFIIKIICILFSTIGALFLKMIDVKLLQKDKYCI